MIYKPRKKPQELRMLATFNPRWKVKQHYINLEKGYEGEIHFDALIETLEIDALILHDLLLKLNSTTFQIDSLILTAEAIFCYEVKNYDGTMSMMQN